MAGIDGAVVQDFFSPSSSDAGTVDGEHHNGGPPTRFFGDLLDQIQRNREPLVTSTKDDEEEANRAKAEATAPKVDAKGEGSQGSSENVRGSEHVLCKIELNASDLWQQGESTALSEAEVGKNEAMEDKETGYRQGNWLVSEILVLLEAKAKEEESASCCGETKKIRLSADDKWKNVSEYCKSKGVNRSKEQCRVKWDNMMPDFRKIREHEEQQKESAACFKSYFNMDAWERRAKILPSNMDIEVYYRVASILSNKPSKGGLKREAREKRACPSSPPPPSLPASVTDSGMAMSMDLDRPPLAELVGKHVAASASRKRRRRKVCDSFPMIAMSTCKAAGCMQTDMTTMSTCKADCMQPDMATMRPLDPPLESQNDDSSTEDDTTVMPSSRPPAPPPASQYLFAERTSLPCQKNNIDFSPLRHRLLFDSNQEAMSAVFAHPPTSQTNGIHHMHMSEQQQRGNGGTGPHDSSAPRAPKLASFMGVAPPDSGDTAMGHSEDRKDARHRELMALEREKLAVFKEATYAMASAMTNAMAVFSKMAEELLMRR